MLSAYIMAYDDIMLDQTLYWRLTRRRGHEAVWALKSEPNTSIGFSSRLGYSATDSSDMPHCPHANGEAPNHEMPTWPWSNQTPNHLQPPVAWVGRQCHDMALLNSNSMCISSWHEDILRAVECFVTRFRMMIETISFVAVHLSVLHGNQKYLPHETCTENGLISSCA